MKTVELLILILLEPLPITVLKLILLYATQKRVS